MITFYENIPKGSNFPDLKSYVFLLSYGHLEISFTLSSLSLNSCAYICFRGSYGQGNEVIVFSVTFLLMKFGNKIISFLFSLFLGLVMKPKRATPFPLEIR